MREKLIQIYADAKVPGQIEREIAKLRCDNCKHFSELPESKPEGSCNTGPAASHAMFIRPDFLCALFEEKQ